MKKKLTFYVIVFFISFSAFGFTISLKLSNIKERHNTSEQCSTFAKEPVFKDPNITYNYQQIKLHDSMSSIESKKKYNKLYSF